jgi:hypothetical protein
MDPSFGDFKVKNVGFAIPLERLINIHPISGYSWKDTLCYSFV